MLQTYLHLQKKIRHNFKILELKFPTCSAWVKLLSTLQKVLTAFIAILGCGRYYHNAEKLH